jgi:hypothetical protein
MNRAGVWVGGCVALLMTARLSAQTPVQNNVENFQRQLDVIQRDTALRVNPALPAGERLLVDYGGYFGASYLSVDDLNKNNHGLRQYDLIGYLRVNLDDVQEFYGRGRLTWQDFNPGDSFDGRGDQFHARIDRGYYSFDLRKALSAYQGRQVDYDVAFQGGRQLIYWANGLSLVQTLDAAVVNLNYKSADLQLLAGVTPPDTIDIDTTRPHFDTNTHRGFYGAMLSKTIGEHRPFVYLLSQYDYNHNYLRTIGPVVTRYHYNSFYAGTGSAGTIGDRVSYGLEAVYEGGRGLSNSFSDDGGSFHQAFQENEEINAFAGDARFDYLMSSENRIHLTTEATISSGDRDRAQSTNTFGGNHAGTNDLGFNSFGQIASGLAFSPNISNLYVLRMGASAFPFPNYAAFREMQAGLDVYFFGKWSDRAPIDEPSLHKGFLGFEPDIYVNWQIKSDVTLATRYGLFFPGVALSNHDARQFFYMGLTFAF